LKAFQAAYRDALCGYDGFAVTCRFGRLEEPTGYAPELRVSRPSKCKLVVTGYWSNEPPGFVHRGKKTANFAKPIPFVPLC
jgi:hypothetical protein